MFNLFHMHGCLYDAKILPNLKILFSNQKNVGSLDLRMYFKKTLKIFNNIWFNIFSETENRYY